jgi:hypothetical protein
MKTLRNMTYFLAGNLVLSLTSVGLAQQQAMPARDGQRDFDFEVGSFHVHLKRLLHPLTGSTSWVEVDGTSVTRMVWDGKAQLEEFETDSSAASHIEGLTLRLYNPESHQWSLFWSNSKTGKMEPPQIGEFKNGRGEFYAQDTLNGKSILVRYIWSNTNTSTPHFEQSFSDDGGKTWEVNWITDQTRIKNEESEVPLTTYFVKAGPKPSALFPPQVPACAIGRRSIADYPPPPTRSRTADSTPGSLAERSALLHRCAGANRLATRA